MCAGSGTRWNNYLGGPKYLAPVDGEPILTRTKRLLQERGYHNITVTGVDYQIDPNECEIDRFYGARKLWEDDNIHLYGDCYYTEHAIDKILNTKYDNFQFYGRGGATKTKKWSEIFAIRFKEDYILPSLKIVRELYKNGEIKRCIGWELYRQLLNIPLNKHKIPSNFTTINDLTDDFDDPDEYDLWIKNYQAIQPQKVFHELHQYNPKKIIHIGCHYCLEADIYKKNNWDCILVDNDAYYINSLKNRGFKAIMACISNQNNVKWYEYKNDQHNSTLMRKDIEPKKKNTIVARKLRDIQEDSDTLVIDCQGSTLDVLQSGDLDKIRVIIAEVSHNPMYENENNYEEVNNYLEDKGFRVVEHYQHGGYDIYDCVWVREL